MEALATRQAGIQVEWRHVIDTNGNCLNTTRLPSQTPNSELTMLDQAHHQQTTCPTYPSSTFDRCSISLSQGPHQLANLKPHFPPPPTANLPRPSLYIVDPRPGTIIPLRRRALPPNARHQHNSAEHHDDAETPHDKVYRGHLPLFPLPYFL